MADFEKNSEKLRVVGIAHKTKDDAGRNEYWCEMERANGQQFKGLIVGNDNIGKWCAAGKNFFGEVREDQAVERGGSSWSKVWRDWDKKANGQPREAQGAPQGGGGGHTPQSVGLDAAAAVYDSFVALYNGDKTKALALFSKLDIMVPYDSPGGDAGYKAGSGSDEEIPF